MTPSTNRSQHPIRRLTCHAVIFSAALFSTTAAAIAKESTKDPLAFVRSIAEEVLVDLNDIGTGPDIDQGQVEAVVDRKISPHFDYSIMTRLVLGPKWGSASEPQREELARLLKLRVVKAYVIALQRDDDFSLEFRSKRSTRPGRASVEMRIVREGHSKTPVLYRLAERDGDWRIYDVVIGGVSMASTFRASFRQSLRDGGIDGLIESLRERSA